METMKNSILLAVDLGTSFIKTGAYAIDSKCIACASEPVSYEKPATGIFLQYGEQLFQSVVNCIKKTVMELKDQSSRIEAIAFTGQMAGFMGVDQNWNDITTWSCSLDTRYTPYAVRQQRQFSKDFLEISGTNAPLMCAKYEWFKSEFPEKASKIVKYVMISGYVIGRLGEVPIEEATIDGSYVTWSGMGDVKNKQWSRKICDQIGIDMKLLPKIVDSNTICGRLSQRMAEELGLKSGLPLVSGAGDKVAGCVGAGILDFGDMIFEAASYGGFSCMVEDFRPDKEEHYFDIITSAQKGSFYAHKYIQGSGITLDWFIDNFVVSESLDKKAAFKLIDELAGKVAPGSDGILAIGLLGGSAIPFDSAMKGLWMGHNWSHGKGHLYRALLESFSYDLALTIDRVETSYPEYCLDSVKLIGGGAKSRVWAQIMADITGKLFMRLNREDVALWGAAILAGNAVGIFHDIKRVSREYVNIQEIFEPDMDKNRKYQKYKRLYRDFTRELHDFYVRLENLK